MKSIASMGLALLLLGSSLAIADRINLNSPEALNQPSSQKVRWYVSLLDAHAKKMVITYQWLSEDGGAISLFGSETQQWVCRDIVIPGTNAGCIAAGNPNACCTGLGAGTCDDDDLCFSDIFTTLIPAGAVGTPIGSGLRTLIFNRWKSDVLSPGNDGAFE
jgi:hypothetical protein